MTTVWSNFEIADMNFWRGEAYTKYFDYLDATGGFYYEVRRQLTPWFLFRVHSVLISSVPDIEMG